MSEIASDGRRETNGSLRAASEGVPPPVPQRRLERGSDRPPSDRLKPVVPGSVPPPIGRGVTGHGPTGDGPSDVERSPVSPPPPSPPSLSSPPAPPAPGKRGRSTQTKAKLAAGRHSRFVRRAKIWLPILGLIIAGIVIGRAYLLSHIPGINMPAVLFSKNGLTMVEPRLTGRSRDRAYDFGAARATQNYLTPKVVEFEQLSGRVELKNDGWAKVESRTGRYDGVSDGLNLAGHVVVTTSTGYLLNAEDAAIDLSKGNMSTDNPVHIEGPSGAIDAKAARVTDSGNTILFTGGVHVMINPASVPPSIGPATPGAAPPQPTSSGPKP